MGEGETVGAPAAIANTVADALSVQTVQELVAVMGGIFRR
jgi:hypothetical protein